jgi:hypothetical protein
MQGVFETLDALRDQLHEREKAHKAEIQAIREEHTKELAAADARCAQQRANVSTARPALFLKSCFLFESSDLHVAQTVLRGAAQGVSSLGRVMCAKRPETRTCNAAGTNACGRLRAQQHCALCRKPSLTTLVVRQSLLVMSMAPSEAAAVTAL